MATLFFCNKLFYKQFRQLHRSAVVLSLPTFNWDKEKKALQAVLPEVMNSLITGPKLGSLPEVGSRVKQALDYTMTGGMLRRVLTVSTAYQIYEEPENFSEETQHSARVLGWCLEMASLCVADDMFDGATTRRGKPCWYTLPNVGNCAVIDTLLMYQSTMEMLEIHFGKKHFYNDMIKLINDAVYQVSMGEYLDCASGYNKEKNNIDVITMRRCSTIALYKSGYYWFKLPIFVALSLVKNGNEKATEELNYICVELGKLLQFQDDYTDAYGDETIIGKKGRDIQEGKCSWLAATALERCNTAQRSIFKEYYGSEDPEHVKRIKQLYDELKLKEVFEQFERDVCDDLVQRIHALPTERETQFLLELLNLYYKKRLY